MSNYDAIVLGTGGVGSAALFHLARRGSRVLGLDRFPAGHDQGSSHGTTRLIRQAYYEHPDYVPLLKRAYPLWEELEQLCQQPLYHQSGIIEVGPADGELVRGILATASEHDLPIELLDADETEKRWPGFRVPADYQVVFEQRSGFLMVEDCVRAHLKLAQAQGAEVQFNQVIRSWQADGDSYRVQTESDVFHADRLIITMGSWAGPMLLELGLQFKVLKKPLHWYRAERSLYHQEQGCPCFFYEIPEGHFYGFPAIGDGDLKVALHSGGDEVTDPMHVDRTLDRQEQEVVETFLANYLPSVNREATGHAVCMYTMAADRFFVVDRLAEHAGVLIAAGLSGHGFKFTSVLGETLAQLALDGSPALPIDFLSIQNSLARQRQAGTEKR